jgi:hypothetical protein
LQGRFNPGQEINYRHLLPYNQAITYCKDLTFPRSEPAGKKSDGMEYSAVRIVS